MDLENKKFGRGPKELGGAADLINHSNSGRTMNSFARIHCLCRYQRQTIFEMWSETEIRKGKGMELNQLFQNASDLRRRNPHIGPFDLGLLGDAFHMRETARVDLPFAEKGMPTKVSKSRAEPKDKKRKRRKQKDRGKEKDKNCKHKYHHKDISSDKNKSEISHHDSGPEHLKKPQDKKRRYAGNGDLFNVHGQQNGQNSRRIKMGKLKRAG